MASDQPDTSETDSAPDPPDTTRRLALGKFLVVASCALWFTLFAIPFVPLPVAQKTVLGTAVFVAVQILWWGGIALAGPEFARGIKDRLRRFRGNSSDDENPDA